MAGHFRWNSLNEALRRQDEEDVRQWLAKSSALSQQDWAGRYPLHGAPSVSLVKLLLDAGANIGAEDNAGLTALDIALRKGNHAVALALLEAGAKPRPAALHWAAWKGSPRVVEALMAQGLKATAQDVRGQSPLHWVFRSHSGVSVHAEAVARLLLANGGSWVAPDHQGTTPKDLLKQHQAWLSQWPVRFGQWAYRLWLRLVGKKTLSDAQRLLLLEKSVPAPAAPALVSP